jgi:phosphotransferase system IIB component
MSKIKLENLKMSPQSTIIFNSSKSLKIIMNYDKKMLIKKEIKRKLKEF